MQFNPAHFAHGYLTDLIKRDEFIILLREGCVKHRNNINDVEPVTNSHSCNESVSYKSAYA